MLGPLLAQSLARNIGGNALRSELDRLCEPLRKLVSRYPMAKEWLQSGLDHPSFPSQKVDAEQKSLFVKKIIRYAPITRLLHESRTNLSQSQRFQNDEPSGSRILAICQRCQLCIRILIIDHDLNW